MGSAPPAVDINDVSVIHVAEFPLCIDLEWSLTCVVPARVPSKGDNTLYFPDPRSASERVEHAQFGTVLSHDYCDKNGNDLLAFCDQPKYKAPKYYEMAQRMENAVCSYIEKFSRSHVVLFCSNTALIRGLFHQVIRWCGLRYRILDNNMLLAFPTPEMRIPEKRFAASLPNIPMATGAAAHPYDDHHFFQRPPYPLISRPPYAMYVRNAPQPYPQQLTYSQPPPPPFGSFLPPPRGRSFERRGGFRGGHRGRSIPSGNGLRYLPPAHSQTMQPYDAGAGVMPSGGMQMSGTNVSLDPHSSTTLETSDAASTAAPSGIGSDSSPPSMAAGCHAVDTGLPSATQSTPSNTVDVIQTVATTTVEEHKMQQQSTPTTNSDSIQYCSGPPLSSATVAEQQQEMVLPSYVGDPNCMALSQQMYGLTIETGAVPGGFSPAPPPPQLYFTTDQLPATIQMTGPPVGGLNAVANYQYPAAAGGMLTAQAPVSLYASYLQQPQQQLSYSAGGATWTAEPLHSTTAVAPNQLSTSNLNPAAAPFLYPAAAAATTGPQPAMVQPLNTVPSTPINRPQPTPTGVFPCYQTPPPPLPSIGTTAYGTGGGHQMVMAAQPAQPPVMAAPFMPHGTATVPNVSDMSGSVGSAQQFYVQRYVTPQSVYSIRQPAVQQLQSIAFSPSVAGGIYSIPPPPGTIVAAAPGSVISGCTPAQTMHVMPMHFALQQQPAAQPMYANTIDMHRMGQPMAVPYPGMQCIQLTPVLPVSAGELMMTQNCTPYHSQTHHLRQGQGTGVIRPSSRHAKLH